MVVDRASPHLVQSVLLKLRGGDHDASSECAQFYTQTGHIRGLQQHAEQGLTEARRQTSTLEQLGRNAWESMEDEKDAMVCAVE
jgi:hypothetical protein